MKKTENKGFSLVELIVVVLIIGVLSAALVPQVIRWIRTSQVNVDTNNIAEIKLCAETALIDFVGHEGNVPDGGVEFYIRKEGICENAFGTANLATEDGDAYAELARLIDATMLNDYPQVINVEDKVYLIFIKSNTLVEVTIVSGSYE